MHSWKRTRILNSVALVLAIDDGDGASKVMEVFGEKVEARQIQHEIYFGKFIGQHEFFSLYAIPKS